MLFRSEVERLWADNAKARRMLGWAPRYEGRAGFAHGLEETVAWFSKPGVLDRYKPELYNI